MVIDLAISAWFGTRFIVTRDSIISQAGNLSSLQCGLDRARGSVRRTSGFVQISITLKVQRQGDSERHRCYRQLTLECCEQYSSN